MFSRVPSASDLTQLQIDCVAKWHNEPIANPYDGFKRLVCQQHEFNYRLWHEEDVARSPEANDTRIAAVKRSIDQLNQQRNDMIEQIDDAIAALLEESGVGDTTSLPINTETAGSAIDRLSIISLRLYHYAEQCNRSDVDEEHRVKMGIRTRLCQTQHADLSHSLQTLLDDLFAGRKQHKTYRQMKMYNDPSLNPEIYRAKK